MLTEEMIREMLSLQDKLNQRLNPEWAKAGYDWDLAVMVECAELIEHLDWKWWKKKDSVNVTQVHLELVDIWHFILSSTIEYGYEDGLIQRLSQYSDAVQRPLSFGLRQEELIEAVKWLSLAPAANHPLLIRAFMTTLDVADLSAAELYRLYVAKAALNLFRWDHGYKTGEYVKDWGGVEDNVYLERLLKQNPEMTSVEILDFLSQRYMEITT